MSSSWNKEYYDIMNFYYWEPQHLGKIKNKESKIQNINDALNHIAKMEVSLNHQFNLFFQLLPSELTNIIFNKIDCRFTGTEKLEYQSIEDISVLNLKDSTQPDVFFKSNTDLVAIEFKLGTKSSIEQLLKYATLFHFTRLHHQKNFKCHLVYVGVNSFDSMFKEKFSHIDLVQDQLELVHIPDVTKKGSIDLTPHKDEILNLAKDMSLSFVNYQQLHDLFDHSISALDTANPYTETIHKLISGMNNELIYRNLAKA